jgi:SapC
MSAQPAAGQAELTGNVMFYKQPEPLSLEKHRSLGAKRVDRPFEFLGGSHVVPITVNEFGMAASSYPVIFAGAKKTPLAVMGIRGGENVFISRTGEVDPEIYLPAFVRRYPFVFASDGGNERLLVCIDRAAAMIGENPEVPFFNGDQPSQYTQDAIEFCKEFERHRVGTEAFVAAIDQLGLFEEKDVTLTQQAADKQEQIKIADYFAISEEKLNALPIDKVKTLHEQGMLGPIYAHLVSLLTWPKIINRGLMIASADAQAQARANTPLA